MKLFWRIFLTFWIATILMHAFVLSINEFLPIGSPHAHSRPLDTQAAQSSLQNAVNSYERQGAEAFYAKLRNGELAQDRAIYLFNQNARLLERNGSLHASYAQAAQRVLEDGRSQMLKLDNRRVFVCPVQSSTGRRYAVVVMLFEPGMRLLRSRFWINVTIGLLPGGLICMFLSMYLTRPIMRLQKAAQRIASGDLDARFSTDGTIRRDELGNLTRDLDAMASQIRSLMGAQRRFVADVSHELGGPLTRMHLALSLLRRQFDGRNSSELRRIDRETTRLISLVQQLLLLATLEAGTYPAEDLTSTSLGALCENLIEDANFEAAQAKCRVVGTREDVTAVVYPQFLRRAIDNVLRNAIRYAPLGSEIVFNCKVDRHLHRIVLEILDSGPGVPESMLTDIFRPFFRTAPGRERKSGGTGLGLSIASEAVRLHEGTIVAQNRQSGGLQVTITLPLRLPIQALEPGRAAIEV
jgi:two-component system, OmpR family, sensor histidine kinase CpxA